MRDHKLRRLERLPCKDHFESRYGFPTWQGQGCFALSHDTPEPGPTRYASPWTLLAFVTDRGHRGWAAGSETLHLALWYGAHTVSP
jgi:hypothetical protein